MGRILIGTASWTDPTLVKEGNFYPPDAKSAEARLRFYAEQFPIVEVDSTYYFPPTEKNAALWIERTPPQFVFNVKAFALLTQHPVAPRSLPQVVKDMLPPEAHEKGRLYPRDLPPEARDLVSEMFVSGIEPLFRAGKLGMVLFQFPHWFGRNRGSIDYLHELVSSFEPPATSSPRSVP